MVAIALFLWTCFYDNASLLLTGHWLVYDETSFWKSIHILGTRDESRQFSAAEKRLMAKSVAAAAEG